jgi:hypothetical protein
MSDSKYDVAIREPGEIVQFIEARQREDVDLLTPFQAFIAEKLAHWKMEGKGHWPALTQLFGPLSLKAISGPLMGEYILVYGFSISAAPIKEGEDAAVEKLEEFFCGFRIEENELVEFVTEGLVN